MQIVTGTHPEKVKTFGSTLNMPCNDFMIPVPLLSMVAWARRNKYKWPLTADQVVLFEAAAEKDTLKETKETRKLKNKISALNKRKADLEAKLEAEHAAAELVELAGNKKARK